MQQLCIDIFYSVYGPISGKNKLEEGFRLCWLLTNNNTFKDPEIINYNSFKSLFNEIYDIY